MGTRLPLGSATSQIPHPPQESPLSANGERMDKAKPPNHRTGTNAECSFCFCQNDASPPAAQVLIQKPPDCTSHLSLISSSPQPGQARRFLCSLPASAGKDKQQHQGGLPNRPVCRALLISKGQAAAWASIPLPPPSTPPAAHGGCPAGKQRLGVLFAAQEPNLSHCCLKQQEPPSLDDATKAEDGHSSQH